MQGYVFNLRRPIFARREVRKALALALDFDWSNENLFYGQYTANASYFDNSELAAQGLPSPAERKLLEPLRDELPAAVFDDPMGAAPQGGMRERLRRAKALLNEAGWAVRDGVLTETATGRPMRFTITLVSPAFERITEPFTNNLRRLGVQASMKVVDTSVYEQLVRTFDFDMVVGTFGQSQSPGNEQRDYWHSEAAGQEGSRNLAGVRNPAVDALVEAIIAAPTREALVTATRALDRVLWHEHYVVPQWYIDSHRVTYWNKFAHPARLPLYYGPAGYLTYWWVDPAKAEALRAAVAAGRAFTPPR
jgi:microcin C transport system substrate-binding protein